MILSNYFYIDICSLIFTISIIAYSYVKGFWIGTNFQSYMLSLSVTFVSILTNIISYLIIKLVPLNEYSIIFANIFVNISFAAQAIVLSCAIAHLFISIGIWNTIVRNLKFKITFFLVASVPIVLLLVNTFYPFMFYINDYLQFKGNENFHLMFLVESLMLLVALIFLLYYRSYVSKQFFVLGMIIIPGNIICVLLQTIYLENSIILMSYVFSCFIVSISMERIELMNSRCYMAKSIYSFYLDSNKLISLKEPGNYIFIKIVNHKNIQRYLGDKFYSKLLYYLSKKIYHQLNKNKIPGIFYYLEDSAFVFQTEEVSVNKLKAVLNPLAKVLQNEHKIGNFTIYIDTRICIANYPDDIYNQEYLKYFAKHFHDIVPAVKDVLILSEITSTKQFTLKNEIDFIINRGLRDNNFEIYYQPIFSAKDNRFVSAEALLRLNDPDFGNIPPSIFIPFAENSNLIYKISDFVFESVGKFIASPEFAQLKLENIEINLSTGQCIDNELGDKVRNCLKQFNISPELLRLDITEAAVDLKPEIVTKNVFDLKEIGVSFALDNYGTGFTDIKQLINLPINIVKLDPKFIKNYNLPKNKIVIDSTINLIKDLNKNILIGGVEDNLTAIEFINCGCNLLQGYYYSRPLPKDKFIASLTQ